MTHDHAARERVRSSPGVAVEDGAARLADDQPGRGDVPGPERAVHEEIETARGHVADLEGGAPDDTHARRRLVEGDERRVLARRGTEGEARDDEAVGERSRVRDPDRCAVERGAPALARDEELARAGRVDRRRTRPALLGVRDDHAVEGDATREVQGAVDRVDDPERATGRGSCRALFRQHGYAGSRLGEAPDDLLLRAMVGSRREVRAALLPGDDADVVDGDLAPDLARDARGELRERRVTLRHHVAGMLTTGGPAPLP